MQRVKEKAERRRVKTRQHNDKQEMLKGTEEDGICPSFFVGTFSLSDVATSYHKASSGAADCGCLDWDRFAQVIAFTAHAGNVTLTGSVSANVEIGIALCSTN